MSVRGLTKLPTSILSIANLAAQFLPLLALPFIAKSFGPAIIGEFVYFTIAMMLISELGTLKYDAAILVSNEDEVLPLVCVSFIMLLICTSALGFLSILLSPLLKGFVLFSSKIHVLLLFFAVLGQFFFKVQYALSNRLMNTKLMSLGTILPPLVYNLMLIIFAINSPTLVWMLIARVFSFLIIALPLLLINLRVLMKSSISLKSIRLVFVKYRIYAFSILPGKAANLLSLRVAELAIGSSYGVQDVGVYSLAKRLVSLPENVIGKAFSDVFRRKYYSQNNIIDKVAINRDFAVSVFRLLGGGVVIFILIYTLGPICLNFFFDSKWSDLGAYIILLIPGYFVSFIVSPFTPVFRIFSREKLELFFQAFFFLTALIVFILSSTCQLSIQELVMGFSFQRVLSFFVAIALILWVLRREK